MRVWTLTTRISGHGTILCHGMENESQEIVFFHPVEADEIILRTSVKRAYEISRWTFHRSQKMNMRIVVVEKENKEHDHCQCGGMIVAWSSGDGIDAIHSIPYCDAYKQHGNRLYQGREKRERKSDVGQ